MKLISILVIIALSVLLNLNIMEKRSINSMNEIGYEQILFYICHDMRSIIATVLIDVNDIIKG